MTKIGGTTVLVFAQEVTFNFLHFIYIALLYTSILNDVMHTYYIPSPLFIWTGAAIIRSGIVLIDGR